ncbi:MAG: glycosyltransferase [Bacteroidales bacterium]|nr:glycosyltransferase [Bacteroidales bacterium]
MGHIIGVIESIDNKTMRVIIVSKTPTHMTTAGNRRGILVQAELLKSLGCDVHFLYIQELPLSRTADRESYRSDLEEMRAYWGNRLSIYNVSKIQKLYFNILSRIRKYFFKYECGIDDEYPAGLARFFKKLNSKHHFDICIVNYYYLTKLLGVIDVPVKAVFTHDCFAYRNQVVGDTVNYLNADSEARAVQRAEHIFAVQEEEFAYYSLLAPRSTVYNVFCLYTYKSQPSCFNHNLLYLAGNGPLNLAGIEWFISAVFPLIRDEFHDAKLIIGGGICRALSQFQDIDGIELQGYVADASSFYAQGDVAINPVYQGTGLKIKTFEAVSYDKVTITHPHSAKGIFNPTNAPIIVCQKPEDWAMSIKRVWSDPSLIGDTKKKNGEYISALREFVESEYERFLNNAEIQLNKSVSA